MENKASRKIKIATRGSELALWQANWVAGELSQHGVESELVIIETQGDREQGSFGSMSGQGFFTKAVQDALLDGRADVAVHSYKDLPSAKVKGLVLAAVPEREAPHEILVAHKSAVDMKAGLVPLKQGVRVGTSAVRRRSQLSFNRPDLQLLELRGNVPTRVQKLRDGNYDAIILAYAGVSRLELNLSDLIVYKFPLPNFVPAPSQGALAIEVREDDDYALLSLQTLNHYPSRRLVEAERGLMEKLDGGCQLALGACATVQGESIRLLAWYETSLFMADGEMPEAVAEKVFNQIRAAFPVKAEA